MPQQMIHNHDRHHRLGNRRCAYADAGVVAAFGDYVNRLALQVDASTRQAQAGGWERRIIKMD